MLVCRSGAKINLTLEVLSRRSDGYHMLKSVVHSIGLWDTLHFECGVNPGFSLRSNWPALMTDDNLCLRAAKAWTDMASAKTPQRFGGVRITLEKTIPLGSGLGGGSSNAAATLLALNEYHQHLLEPEELAQIALKLGADVPFFLQGGCALMEGIGEKLTSLPLMDAWAVLICPPHHAGTADIFRAFDQNSNGSASKHTSPSEALMEYLNRGELHAMKNFLYNDLQNAAASNGIDSTQLIKILLENGAQDASMSGSGSAVFGLFATQDHVDRARGKITEKLERNFQVHTVPLTSSSYIPLPPPAQ